MSEKHWPPLLDAAGNEIAVSTCVCGRPKYADGERCCGGCPSHPAPAGFHSTACNMRCSTLGMHGFGVVAVATPRAVEYATVSSDPMPTRERHRRKPRKPFIPPNDAHNK